MEAIMMKTDKNRGQIFLSKMQECINSKEQIFNTLFEACGCGENVNTKHVFFQEVIIKFNASKAKAVIEKNLPYVTESHFVDVAIYAYMKAGFNIKDFDADLNKYKTNCEFAHMPAKKCVVSYAEA